jgi:hypothetical protein
MPASVALTMAQRLGARVYASPRLLRRGAAGEGHAPAAKREELAAMRPEALKLREADELLDLAWAKGLAPEAGCRTVRFAVDEAQGLIAIYLGRSKRPVAAADLGEYQEALAIMRRDAARGMATWGQSYRGGRMYRVKLVPAGEDLAYRFTLV